MSFAFKMNNVKRKLGAFNLDIPELQLERGYILGLVGQNGAGKSTLLKILMNLVYPDHGQVEVLGLLQPEQEIRIRQKIGYVSENPSFYENVTVENMARLVSRFYPDWDSSLYQRYLRKFSLSSGKKVKELSRGMKVKLALLLALSHRPELLILDEPTSGLDPVVRLELLEEIAEVIRDENRSVIFSSHISQDIEQIADYIAIINQGQVAAYQDKETLLDDWRQISGSLPDHLSHHELPFAPHRQEGRNFVAVANNSATHMSGLQRLGVTNLRVEKVNLDTILVSLAKKGEDKCIL